MLSEFESFLAALPLPCDEVGLVGGEVDDERGDLLCGADAAHLLAGDEVSQRGLGVGRGLDWNGRRRFVIEDSVE